MKNTKRALNKLRFNKERRENGTVALGNFVLLPHLTFCLVFLVSAEYHPDLFMLSPHVLHFVSLPLKKFYFLLLLCSFSSLLLLKLVLFNLSSSSIFLISY